MRTWSIHLLGVVLTVLAVAAPRTSSAGDLQLEGGVTTEYPTARSYDALSDQNLNGALGFRAAYNLEDLIPFEGFRGVLEINSTAQDASRFDDTYDLGWSRGMYLLGADLGREVGGFLRPFIRLTGGYVRQQLRLQAEGSPSFSQRAHDFVTKDSIGLEVFLPYGENQPDVLAISDTFTFGLSGQFGYLWQTPAVFDDMRASGSSNDGWNRTGIDLGRLDSTGLFWDVGLFVRFAM